MNLKNRLLQSAKTATEERTKILMGDFNAVLESVKSKTFKSGSFGFVFVYGITDQEAKGRKIYENIVLSKKDGSAVEYGDDRFIRRLYTLGIDDAALENFNIPENDTEQGDMPKLQGTKVIVTLERKLKDDGTPEQNLKKVTPVAKKAVAA